MKFMMTLLANEKQQATVNYDSFGELIELEKQREKNKIKWLIFLQILTTTITLLVMGIFYVVARPTVKETHIFTNFTTMVNITEKHDIVTLYALDPIAKTFCFDDGKYGMIISNLSLYNRQSDIEFNTYQHGSFRVGIEGGRAGTIIDLGSSEDLEKRYNYQETSGNGQGYASIHRVKKTILILKGSPYKYIFQPMEESAQLFREGTSPASASINLGHFYLVRITDRYTPDFERIVKMLVIAYKPNEMVTIRWEVLL